MMIESDGLSCIDVECSCDLTVDDNPSIVLSID